MFPTQNPVGGGETAVPGKIEAAQRFLHYINSVRRPASGSMFNSSGDMPSQEQELSKREQAAYDAALDVMILYFRCEMDFGDTNPGTTPYGGGDGEDPRQPVEA